MRYLIELGQIAVALFVSGAVATLVGSVYVAVAALVIATCAVLLFEAARQRSVIVEVPLGLGELLSIAGASIVFGLVWPAIPLILTWKHVDAASGSGGAGADDRS